MASGECCCFDMHEQTERLSGHPQAGGLESGETFEQAAWREASEEPGLTSSTLKRVWERTTDFVYH